MTNDYQWQQSLPKPAAFKAGDLLKTRTFVNFRESPGGTVLATLQPDTPVIVVDSAYVQTPDGLVWWKVRPQKGAAVQGWVAQFTPHRACAPGTIDASPAAGLLPPR